MKHLNKTIFTATLLTSFLLGQPVLAGEKATHGDYSDHAATSLQSEITAHKMEHEHNEQAKREENSGPVIDGMGNKHEHNPDMSSSGVKK